MHKLQDIMRRLIFLVVLLTSVSGQCQDMQQFLSDFLLEDELKKENFVDEYTEYDFSDVWLEQNNEIVYGIIGKDHRRIHIKFLSITKSSQNPNMYLVSGKSMVNGNICDFSGNITIQEIREVIDFHLGTDDEFNPGEFKKQGILRANYSFVESPDQAHSGKFQGSLYSKWFINSKDEVEYDDIQSIADSYMNNAYIGTWKSHNKSIIKTCNWADWRVPFANSDFDIGAGEFSVSEKYASKGWLDIVLKNKAPNSAIEEDRAEKPEKKWWQ